jgi:hypothetical protein
MPPSWLTVVAWISIAAGFVSAAAVLYDIYGNELRQPVRVMEAVWPITALYLGPLGVLLYGGLGRPRRIRVARDAATPSPRWQGLFISATHCGAGCALGDIIAEWLVFLTGATIGGVVLWTEYAVDFVFAYVLGILFQYFAIKSMMQLSSRDALSDAIRADTLSVIAFEVGMFAWMALVFFVFFPNPHLRPDHPVFWLIMQIAMAIGLATTYPVQIWLVGHGIKHAMSRPMLPAVAPRG